MKKFGKLLTALSASALVAIVLTPVAAQADLAVPKTSWPVCDDFRVDFCIESVTIRPLGTRTDLVLTWYDSGKGPAVIEEESPAEFIDGPEVIVPGSTDTFAANLPELYAEVPAKFVYTGTGTATYTDGLAAVATIAVAADVEQADGTLELFADLNLDGEYAPDEIVASKYIAIGSASLVGTGAQETQAGPAVSGRWAHEKWKTYGLDAYGYDGLTVDLKTANFFTNHLFFTVYPVKANDTNVTSRAVRTDGTGLAANLNMDDKITIKVRTGEILTGATSILL